MCSIIEIHTPTEFTIRYETEDSLGNTRLQRTRNLKLIRGQSADSDRHKLIRGQSAESERVKLIRGQSAESDRLKLIRGQSAESDRLKLIRGQSADSDRLELITGQSADLERDAAVTKKEQEWFLQLIIIKAFKFLFFKTNSIIIGATFCAH
jgi:hypothetical protein